MSSKTLVDPFTNNTPNSDSKEEVTIAQARQLYTIVKELNKRNNTLEVQLATLQVVEQRLNNIETRGKSRQARLAYQTAKVGRPPCFNRTRQEELQGFITQLYSYFQFHSDEFGAKYKKILFIATYLKGQALEQFEPIQQEFLEKGPTEQSPKTNIIFIAFANFEDTLVKVFGVYDKRARAEQDLNNLYQTKSAIEYASRF